MSAKWCRFEKEIFAAHIHNMKEKSSTRSAEIEGFLNVFEGWRCPLFESVRYSEVQTVNIFYHPNTENLP